jgi:hypothetical protein
MHFSNLDLALPIVALATVIGLLKLVRHLLHTPDSDAPDLDPWNRITSRWNRWITWVLPVPIGIAILAVTAWFFAYLGWAADYVFDRPTALRGFPPWFGSAKLFVENTYWGIVTAIVVALFGGALALTAHLVGKCLIWPEVCGCENDNGSPKGKHP